MGPKPEKGVRANTRPFQQFVGSDGAAKRLDRALKKIARRDDHVLIIGDVGTGKSHSAQCLHALSKRCNRPFVSLNCAALGCTIDRDDVLGCMGFDGQPETAGLLELAEGGILFLDNFEDLPAEYQALFAHILKSCKYQKNGATTETKLDIRIIATASDTLMQRVQSGKFNKALFSLLSSNLVRQPSLKQRRQDIPGLVLFFLKQYCEKNELEIPAVPAEIFESVMDYEWHGNIRELQDCIKNLVMMSPAGQLCLQYLPFDVKKHPLDFLEVANLNGVISDIEGFLIRKALTKYAGNQVKAARQLGIPEATLRFKIKKYDISKEVI